ncbi:MAG: hypothetical protein RML36_15315 [Anaerolineae bacterium]|nr:hypothetical protein [Anaerolineae bacterium]
MTAVQIVIALARLIQAALPLPDWRDAASVKAWLERIKDPAAQLIVLIIASLAGPKFGHVEMGALAEAAEKEGIDPDALHAAVQVYAILQDYVEK